MGTDGVIGQGAQRKTEEHVSGNIRIQQFYLGTLESFQEKSDLNEPWNLRKEGGTIFQKRGGT